VAFLYDLLRDHLSFGKVERLVQVNEEIHREHNIGDVHYSNRKLEEYARELAQRLLARERGGNRSMETAEGTACAECGSVRKDSAEEWGERIVGEGGPGFYYTVAYPLCPDCKKLEKG